MRLGLRIAAGPEQMTVVVKSLVQTLLHFTTKYFISTIGPSDKGWLRQINMPAHLLYL
jgi:hypothetical protein